MSVNLLYANNDRHISHYPSPLQLTTREFLIFEIVLYHANIAEELFL